MVTCYDSAVENKEGTVKPSLFGRSSVVVLAALILVMLALFAACGGGGGGTKETPTGAPASPVAETPAAEETPAPTEATANEVDVSALAFVTTPTGVGGTG